MIVLAVSRTALFLPVHHLDCVPENDAAGLLLKTVSLGVFAGF